MGKKKKQVDGKGEPKTRNALCRLRMPRKKERRLWELAEEHEQGHPYYSYTGIGFFVKEKNTTPGKSFVLIEFQEPGELIKPIHSFTVAVTPEEILLVELVSFTKNTRQKKPVFVLNFEISASYIRKIKKILYRTFFPKNNGKS